MYRIQFFLSCLEETSNINNILFLSVFIRVLLNSFKIFSTEN
uniref:Uncharacterized protein n=1 Tax=Anguilla anguilla TaxID=7936 RepID=A0A0E9R552_ANGAN